MLHYAPQHVSNSTLLMVANHFVHSPGKPPLHNKNGVPSKCLKEKTNLREPDLLEHSVRL